VFLIGKTTTLLADVSNSFGGADQKSRIINLERDLAAEKKKV
jgi:hypothetical protein